MARTKKSTTVPRNSKSQAAPNIQNLQSSLESGIAEYGRAKKTKEAYSGHVRRAKEFLVELVKECKRNPPSCKGLDDGSRPIDFAKLEAALGEPNRYSAQVVQLFLTKKCFQEGLFQSTAEGIHGALADYWDTMDDNGKYSGKYEYNPTADTVTGCPARAPCVKFVMKAIKNMAHQKGSSANRQHAEAMTIEDLTRIIEWSEQLCPSSLFDNAVVPSSISQLLLMLRHGMFRAFASLGFTIWTRNFEACQIQRQDVTWNLQGPAPYHQPMWSIHLENRKGWQKKAGYDGPLQSNLYHIYKQDKTALDVFTHLPRFTSFVERRLGRELLLSDYIFPYFSFQTGAITSQRLMTHEIISDLIDEFSKGAGIDTKYTTHCFRRGGAQYRFMYAPIGKRWSLTLIRWWGGWAVGEHVDTLIKYLVDSLQALESGHSDALHPTQPELDKSFMGEQALMGPASTEEVQQALMTATRILDDRLSNITNALQAHISEISRTAMQTITENLQSTSNPIIRPTPSSQPIFTIPNAPRCHPAIPLHSQPESQGSQQLNQSSPSSRTERVAPPPGISIPDIPHGPRAWRRAVEQWEEVSPDTNLALKDWPPAWYTKDMRIVFAAKRSTRKTIAEEFEKYGRNEEHFLSAYPEASEGVTKLLGAIRRQNARQRRSKNGSPEERQQGSRQESGDR